MLTSSFYVNDQKQTNKQKQNFQVIPDSHIPKSHPLIFSVSWNFFTLFSGTYQQNPFIFNHFIYFPLIFSLNEAWFFFVDPASHANFQEMAISLPHHLHHSNHWDWRWSNVLFALECHFHSNLFPSS